MLQRYENHLRRHPVDKERCAKVADGIGDGRAWVYPWDYAWPEGQQAPWDLRFSGSE